MGEQRHRIKRQTLELKVSSNEVGQSVYAELRRIYDQRIVPLIDQCCSELSRPDQIHRIDHLALDLGLVDPNNLEVDLVNKIHLQLRRQLSDQILTQQAKTASHEADQNTGSQHELLAFFARTGDLPWWADPSASHLLQDAVADLSRNRPKVLLRLCRELLREVKPLQRIVRYFEDPVLCGFCTLPVPSLHGSFCGTQPALLRLLKSSQIKGAVTEGAMRNIFWEATFRVSYARQGESTPPQVFWQDVLLRVASALACTVSGLTADLNRGLRLSGYSFDPAAVKMLEELFLKNRKFARKNSADHGQKDPKSKDPKLASQNPEAPSTLPGHASQAEDVRLPLISSPTYQEIERVLQHLKQGGGGWESLFAPLRALLDQLPVRFYAPLLKGLASLNVKKLGMPSEDQAMKETLRKMLLTFRAEAGVSEAAIRPCLLALEDAEKQYIPESSFSDADERYVTNAGLVILWPFLSHFFKHLDLLEKQGFKDRSSLHRAVALLHTLVTEETEPAEYSLTLNRILCGMDLDAVFDLDPEISEEEVTACRDFLEAVIAQVPILKKMSAAGFRGTFLLREGVLSARDGAWLLRVTRTDFDVVLDRFPWSVNWVKLPWMSMPLQVEW